MKLNVQNTTPVQTPTASRDALVAWWDKWVQRVKDPNGHSLSGAGPIVLDAGPSEAGWHRIETYLKCPRLYQYLYSARESADAEAVAKISAAMEKNEVPALILGSLIHVLIAHYSARWAAVKHGFPYKWQSGVEPWNDGRTVRRVPSYSERTITDANEIVDPYIAAQVVAGRMIVEEGRSAILVGRMLDSAVASFKVWQQRQMTVLAGLKIIGVERPTVHEFETSTGERRRISSRIDRVTQEEATGRVFNEDHKSAAAPELARTMDMYTISGQMALLDFFGRYDHGEKFGGVRLNIVGTDADRTMRHRIAPGPAPALAEEVLHAIVDAEEGILRNRASGYFPPRMSSSACLYGNRRCDGWELCTLGAGMREVRRKVRLER